MAKQDKTILGSWIASVATPNQGTFPALLTFTADGGVIGAESPHAFQSSAHGSWGMTELGQVAYTFMALFGSPEGKNRGKLKVVGTLQSQADAENWDGPFKIEIFDADGRVSLADRGTFHLTRIPIEPMD